MRGVISLVGCYSLTHLTGPKLPQGHISENRYPLWCGRGDRVGKCKHEGGYIIKKQTHFFFIQYTNRGGTNKMSKPMQGLSPDSSHAHV